jgi:two-component system, OmpR family, sensor histidine kinase KdpD
MQHVRQKGTRRPGGAMLPWWAGGPAAAALATALGLAAGLNATGAAAILVLAVIAAALVSGRGGSLVASVGCFLALNYFFTPPTRTFAVDKTEDFVALGVFLVVSLVVSRLFSVLLAERLRAERRERELGRLYEVAQSLLSSAPLEQTLGEIARSLVDVFGLAGAEIRVEQEEDASGPAGPGGEGPRPVEAASGSVDGPSPVRVALGKGLGTVLLHPREHGRVDDETLGLAEAFVSQAALAVERTRLDRRARKAHLESEAAGTRAALFSAVTHDLKTPLASVKAAVTSLLDPEATLTDADGRALLETILAEADRLGRLLGNLLDLARLQAKALEPKTERADLAELVGAVLQRLRPSLDGHEVDVAIREDLPEVSVDVVQIDQVLTNLLENAVRFSPAGAPIRVAASRWQSSVEVRVVDRGPGIPPDERERVFESFWRRDRGEARGGSGLGLTISRAIVVAHRGRMRIEDTPGGGATVVFSLPFEDGR